MTMQRNHIHPVLGSVAAVALAFALPLAAQQATTQTTAAQPASAAASAAPAPAAANSNAAALNATGEPPLKVQSHEGFWGRINPFARKKWVQQHVQPIRDRVNELNGLDTGTASELARLKARTRAEIAAAKDHADRANQAADAAQQQAQSVASQSDQLDQQVATFRSQVENADQYQVAQTANLHFRPGMARLNRRAQSSLQQFLGGLAQEKGYLVEVRAYSAGRGVAAIRNSQDLADAVVRYLVMDENIPLYRIYTVGLGNASRAMSGAAPRRLRRGGQVSIRILRSDLAANNASNAASTPANPQ